MSIVNDRESEKSLVIQVCTRLSPTSLFPALWQAVLFLPKNPSELLPEWKKTQNTIHSSDAELAISVQNRRLTKPDFKAGHSPLFEQI